MSVGEGVTGSGLEVAFEVAAQVATFVVKAERGSELQANSLSSPFPWSWSSMVMTQF
jgi:hypothetical protein